MYLDHRVYQGSSGRVYPLPFFEGIEAEPAVRSWQAIHIENQYLRLVILPELGGRIHIAFDKSTGYDFFYRNTVIKPALVGLTGPWISGGVEFNWPQHHRPATFLPVQSTIEEHDDGSVTIWCSDHDPFARMQATHGIRIHPDRSLIELDVRLHNRTSERHTFLWWANVAVRVHDQYQSFFPEDVGYVADHARRAITAFPNADRPYYGVDYPARAKEIPDGDRIDFYRNIPVPTSYMIVDSEDGFFGGYDHGVGAGFVHWADRRISPGKKQWTWGDAPFGHAWDSLLTDSDGPYVELMAGVYTDNQPDFSWLAPGEVKLFTQYWYPVPRMGVPHQATPYAAVHINRVPEFEAVFAVTEPQKALRAEIALADGTIALQGTADLEPGKTWRIRLSAPHQDGMTVVLKDSEGIVLVDWTARDARAVEPSTAVAPKPAAEIGSIDELYLTGLHLLQHRHPTRSPVPYWEEGLRRDPSDSRIRLALGDLAYRKGDYEVAHEHVLAAARRITRYNANPRDGEVYYLLGLIESRRGDVKEAAAAFAKAGWDANYVAPAGLEGARLAARSGRSTAALEDLDALEKVGPEDGRRATLRVLLLRRLGREPEAQAELKKGLAADPLNVTLLYIKTGNTPSDPGLMRDLALELVASGEVTSALDVLEKLANHNVVANGAINMAPLARYHRALILDRQGQAEQARTERQLARSADLRWCFPAGLDDHDALAAALRSEEDATAASLLGMLLYDSGRRKEALILWEQAIRLGAHDPLIRRNAGLASFNIAHDDARALDHYDHALALAPNDARLLFERDQLGQRTGESEGQRLLRLECNMQLVHARDDLTVEYAYLLTRCSREAEALKILESRAFQPWEGGEGRVLAVWDLCRNQLGLPREDPPANLGEGRSPYTPPAVRNEDGQTDYFATSLPELLLFARET